METVTTRVQRGARWLDEQFKRDETPWWDRIDLDALDLRSMEECVLGQLVGNFERALTRLWMFHPVEYGFNNRWVGITEFGRLKRAWTREIEIRRSKARVLAAETRKRYELVA